ncbi:MAG: hypothetical protein PWR10_999 [Halanaerobiales bacterium]|nr:hypothetical protein [Halanaerobiales bacterium]
MYLRGNSSKKDGRRFSNKVSLKVSILSLLILFCMWMVYYFVFIRRIHTAFTHFFYIPIALAGFFWGRQSIWIALFLGACLMAPYALVDSSVFLVEDLLRVIVFMGIAWVIGTLRENNLYYEKKLADIIAGISIPTFVINKDHIITHFNNACEALTGFSAAEMIGERKQWMPFYSKEKPTLGDLIVDGASEEVINRYYQGKCRKSSFVQGAYEGEDFFPEVGENGRWLHFTAAPLRNTRGEVIGAIETLEDITERKQAEEMLWQQVYHDALTGLPNRMLFNDRFTQALAHAYRNRQKLAVLFLDLDRFKNINDTQGYNVGDQLLQGVAERLTDLVREDDTVARMGGDEFILLLPEIAQAENATKIAKKILEAFKQPLMIGGHEFYITSSIGIVFYPNDGEDAETLLKNADIAMYRAKEQGGNNYQLYDPMMNVKASERLVLENSLRYALEREEFVVYYQPQVSISTGKIIGMEALIRWQHPEWGLLSPAEFIPLAEETGLIIPIGEWVLRTACAQNKAWQEAGYPPVHVAVNLSARQFQQQNLVETVTRVLKETGLEPHYLELEITESIAMQNADFTIVMLRHLEEMGIHISIDDFGTGYSSLSYLKHFPLDTLKIDQSFVRDLTIDPNNKAIVIAIIAMAHSLKFKVIAEGVETQEQLAFLKQQQCDGIQGYLFSKPLPAEAFEKILMRDVSREKPY